MKQNFNVVRLDGGAKKFRYTGPSKKSSLFEDEQSFNQQWNYKTQQAQPNSLQGQFDLDDVWSIKKNVGVKAPVTVNPAGTSFWERGAGKGFYSRHGGLSDDETPASGTANTTGGTSGFGQPTKSYTYSYTKPSPVSDGHQGGPATAGSPRLPSNNMNSMPGNTMSNNMMGNGHNTGLSNGHMPSYTNSQPNSQPTSYQTAGRNGPVSSRYQGPVSSKGWTNARKF